MAGSALAAERLCFHRGISQGDSSRDHARGPSGRWRLGWFAVTAALMAATVALGIYTAERRSSPSVTSGGQQEGLPPGLDRRAAPRIRLADARGGTIDTAALRGRAYVVTFLFANCPDVCPLISQDLKAALARLGSEARRVAVVAVSVDPRGDTRAAVRAFLRRQRLQSNFHYGIGSERELRRVWKAYYAAPQVAGRPESAHSAAVWLVDTKGRWRAHIAAGMSVDPRDIARRLRALLNEDA
jgi:protein SCO1/2